MLCMRMASLQDSNGIYIPHFDGGMAGKIRQTNKRILGIEFTSVNDPARESTRELLRTVSSRACRTWCSKENNAGKFYVGEDGIAA